MIAEDLLECPLLKAVLCDPQRTALMWGSRRISYQQLNLYVNATVRSLKERDIRPGQRVALVCDNSVETLIVIYGLWRLGAVACPVDPHFPVLHIRNILDFLNVRALIFKRSVMSVPIKGSWSTIEITDLIVFEHKEVADVLEDRRYRFSADQEAVIVLTSATSTMPKAAVLTFGNLYYSALGANEVVLLTENSVWLLSLPMFHVSGLGIVWRCLLARAAIKFSTKHDVLQIVCQGGVTHVSMVQTQLVRLLDLPGFKKPERLQAILLGGGPMSVQVLSKALDADLTIFVSYGLTEMASQVATGQMTQVNRACAKILSYRQMMIASDKEVCVRGNTLFKGYWKGQTIERPLDSQGWFHTGDIGEIDSQGCLKILGRKDDMFISGGENIHPQEIEVVLEKTALILQAVVVPVDDSQFGQRPVAFIRWKNANEMLSKDQLVGELQGNLPNFKIPVEFYPWPQAVADEGLKISRKKLAQWLKDRHKNQN